MPALIDLFGIKDLIPHGYCLSWSPVLLWLNVISDMLITLAYYSIPLTLVHFIRQRKDLPYPWLIALFAGFIVACGTTHLLSAITIWIPLYWLDGLLKGMTAILSVATAVLMLWVIPRALSLLINRREREHQLGLFNTLFELTSDCVFLISPKQDFRFVFVNDAVCRHYGVEREQLLKWRIPDWDPNFKTQAELDTLWQETKTKKGFLIETIHRVASGLEVPVEVSVNYLLYQGEEFLAGYFHDITERKKAEEALNEREAWFRYIFNVTSESIFIHDAATGVILDVNDRMLEFFGYSRQEALALSVGDISSNEEQYTQKDAEAIINRTISEGPQLFEWHCRRKDGSLFWAISTSRKASFGSKDYIVVVVRDNTERKQMEKVREEALSRLQKVASRVPGVVYQYRLRPDGSSCFPFASEAIRDIYRVSSEEVCEDASKVLAILHPDDYADIGASIHESARDLTPWCYEYRVKFDDGTVRWLFGNALPEREADGSTLWHGFITDITERKASEAAIAESRNLLLTIIDTAPVRVFWKDRDLRYLGCNMAFAKDAGMACSKDVIGKDDYQMGWVVQAELYRADDRAIMESGIAKLSYDEQQTTSSGQTIWLRTSKVPLRNQHNETFGVLGVYEDITERKKAEEITHAASQYARSLIEASLDPLVTISAEGKITDVNTATEQVTGVDRDNLIGSDFADYFTDPDKAREGYQQVFSQGFVTDYPLAIRHVSGKVTDVLYNASVYRDGNGNVLGVFAAARDITERKLMENELKASEAKFRSIIEVSPVPMAMNDEQLNVTFLNSAFVQTFGYNVDDIPTLADWWTKAYPDPDYRHRVETTWQTTLEKAKQEQTDFPPMEVAVRCNNNSIKTVLVTAVTIHHDFAGMNLAILYDITQRKQIETELTRSNAELEQFAYAVSHDMRQPLRMVTSYLSLIENALTGQLNEETQQFLDFALNGAKRMDAMILSLLDYSRVGRVFEAKTQLSSKASLDEVLDFLYPELSACGGEIKVTGDWPELFASRDELTRLLQNLIGNALKYHEENQPPQVHVHGTISAKSLRVEVRDQGIGIEPSQMDRLFKVFSRLQVRSRFEGTGVGLALCRKIVEHHGGTLGVESAGEGQGCVFWFELPILNAVNSE